ncbi:trissin receptor [Sitodiplosis mosellana]|uniref:trissin receptor n=1 Tax=Sitodiplosis mosellana TaxID=263140 RepID=UPI002443E655|nr:trissin receptor [Sitodiplosis mosellana]
MSRRLRSITNFFLANLAVADLCVGVFCVIQTLTFYLIDSRTVTNIHLNGISEEICIMHRGLFSSKLLDSINLSALYLLPLLVMTILYSRIAVALWRSSQGIERNIAMHHTPAENHGNAQTSQNAASNRTTTKYEKRPVGPTESQVSVDSDKIITTTWRTQSFHHHRHCHSQHSGHSHHPSHSSNNVLRARRGVVRMLIIVVLTFAICNLPLHARKLWQYMSINYHGESNFSALLTPITFLISYFNSAFNPLLYAFLSRNFRKGMREIILCSFKKSNKKTQQRIPLHVSKSVF